MAVNDTETEQDRAITRMHIEKAAAEAVALRAKQHEKWLVWCASVKKRREWLKEQKCCEACEHPLRTFEYVIDGIQGVSSWCHCVFQFRIHRLRRLLRSMGGIHACLNGRRRTRVGERDQRGDSAPGYRSCSPGAWEDIIRAIEDG